MEKEPPITYGLLIQTSESDGYGCSPYMLITLRAVHVKEGNKIRNISNSYGPIDPLEDFTIKTYVHQNYPGEGSADYQFSDPIAVTLPKARAMVATLTKLEKGLAKLTERYGRTQDYGALVARIANVLGVDYIIKTAPDPHRSNYDNQDHSFFSAGDAVYQLNRIVADYRQSHPAPTREAVSS